MKKKMFATVRRYENVTNPALAATKVDEIFVPFISALPGFKEYFWIDVGKGMMISITVFRTLADAISANDKAADFVKENLSDALPAPVRIHAGKIVAHNKLAAK